ncbi:hypothetical protein BG003_003491 [Podila horticola]|nr:hypothetical protein BG003_003491 [Podila horticola]
MPLQQHIAILSIHNPELETIAPTATVVYSTEEAGIDLETVQGPPLSPQDPEHTREEDATPLPIATAVSNVNGITYDYIPACGLPAGFMDESIQDRPQNASEQSSMSTRAIVEENTCALEIGPGTPIATDTSNIRRSQINIDRVTETTKATSENSSTATTPSEGVSLSSPEATDVVTEPTITMNQNVATEPSNATTVQEATMAPTNAKSTEKAKKIEGIIGSPTQTTPSGAIHIIVLSDEEEGFEVTAVVPSKRRAQESTSGGTKDSRKETNIRPKSHIQGTQDCPLEIENGYDPFAAFNIKSTPKGYADDETNEGLKLSPDQMYVIDQVVTKRKNVFFTGSAGTGKSVLLRELILRLKAYHDGGDRARTIGMVKGWWLCP